MSNVGTPKPATQAFIDWYNSKMTAELCVWFTDHAEAQNYYNSIKRYISKYEYPCAAKMIDAFSVEITITDDSIPKYNGHVKLNVLRGGDISNMSWINLKKSMRELAVKNRANQRFGVGKKRLAKEEKKEPKDGE